MTPLFVLCAFGSYGGGLLLLLVFCALAQAAAKPCASDFDDHAAMQSFITAVGVVEWAAICRWLQEWFDYRFKYPEVGRITGMILRSQLAAHRTRAEGWSCCKAQLSIMRSPMFKNKMGRGVIALADCRTRWLMGTPGLDPEFWDLPQLMRSVVKRCNMAACLSAHVMQCMTRFPKCFFGKLAANVFTAGKNGLEVHP